MPWIERNKRYAERYGFIDKPLKKGRRITKRVKVMSETSFPQQVRGIHCVRYSPDSESVAIGFGNGSIQVIIKRFNKKTKNNNINVETI